MGGDRFRFAQHRAQRYGDDDEDDDDDHYKNDSSWVNSCPTYNSFRCYNPDFLKQSFFLKVVLKPRSLTQLRMQRNTAPHVRAP